MKFFLTTTTVAVVFLLFLVAFGLGGSDQSQDCVGVYPTTTTVASDQVGIRTFVDGYVDPKFYAPSNPYGHTNEEDVIDERVTVVQTIVGVGLQRPDIDFDDILTALMVSRQEAVFQLLLPEDSDRDSHGPFQQRPSQGWGTPEELLNPVISSNKFYDVLVKVEDRDSLELTEAAQKVQGSAFPDAYAQWELLGRQILNVGFDLTGDGNLPNEGYDWDTNPGVNCAQQYAKGSTQVTGSASSLAQELESKGYQNGRLPSSLLESAGDCQITTAAGAAESWRAFMSYAESQGVPVKGAYCYRPYSRQISVRNSNCNGPDSNGIWNDPPCSPPTAVPGNSNHGWGLAIDVQNRFGSSLSCNDDEFTWMQQNAPAFGWNHPPWAQCGKSTTEAWHWEYTGEQPTVLKQG